jgi:hypothetical protein
MPVAEIAAAVTGIRSALDIAKAMVGLRDAETFRSKSIELQTVILESLDKAIEARESYAAQLDQIRALEAEVARLKEWNAEKQNYELKGIGSGSVAYMLKPETRGSEPPHWLCPTCFAQGKKRFCNRPEGTKGERGYTAARAATIGSRRTSLRLGARSQVVPFFKSGLVPWGG